MSKEHDEQINYVETCFNIAYIKFIFINNRTMKRTKHKEVERKHELQETQIIKERQKIVITKKRKGIKNKTLKHKEPKTLQHIDLEVL